MRRTFPIAAALLLSLASALPAGAKVDLVTLPERDKVELTIYNSADLTLVRDERLLTLKKGENLLQFAWAGTLIDPTSLELVPKGAGVRVEDLSYPARVSGAGVWNVTAEAATTAPLEITYFTSAIRWRAHYLATLTPDEKALRLEGYVHVANQSGEDYDDVKTRLVVGKINLLDQIAELARRDAPYGRPDSVARYEQPLPSAAMMMEMEDRVVRKREAKMLMAAPRPKEIVKEGLSEYYLYSIEGTEDLPDGWGTRLSSLTAPEVPVENRYRYDESRSGAAVMRFLAFQNDEAHKLGKEPLPDGFIKVFGARGGGGLTYVGGEMMKYVPPGGEAEVSLGPAADVTVEPTLMAVASDGYEWDRYGEISGWEDILSWKIEAANRRDVPVTLEIRRDFDAVAWTVKGDPAPEKVDADTVRYLLTLPPHTEKVLTYEVTMKRGTRAR